MVRHFLAQILSDVSFHIIVFTVVDHNNCPTSLIVDVYVIQWILPTMACVWFMVYEWFVVQHIVGLHAMVFLIITLLFHLRAGIFQFNRMKVHLFWYMFLFLQASSNTVLSHFLGLVFSMELLRSITLSQPPPESVIPKLTWWRSSYIFWSFIVCL